mgnify:CR=1 FL=1
MTFKSPQSLKTIAELINAKFIGDENFQVFGTNEIHRVKAGEIVFVNHPKYYDKALNSDATIILIDKEVDFYGWCTYQTFNAWESKTQTLALKNSIWRFYCLSQMWSGNNTASLLPQLWLLCSKRSGGRLSQTFQKRKKESSEGNKKIIYGYAPSLPFNSFTISL